MHADPLVGRLSPSGLSILICALRPCVEVFRTEGRPHKRAHCVTVKSTSALVSRTSLRLAWNVVLSTTRLLHGKWESKLFYSLSYLYISSMSYHGVTCFIFEQHLCTVGLCTEHTHAVACRHPLYVMRIVSLTFVGALTSLSRRTWCHMPAIDVHEYPWVSIQVFLNHVWPGFPLCAPRCPQRERSVACVVDDSRATVHGRFPICFFIPSTQMRSFLLASSYVASSANISNTTK
ncbi:hypothetical protein HYPSUDRAFT_466475 [Hypholoma sublateritium FD-334 SS-4]|uniref:Uncharacterized protein n=1 Tax=Hypholoma sublateritium (strain FD-334 SS-4) TaxID=945553 RepID=A0A0D2LC53_HYPSF|nr:hypothetical protein HYPSUDRAFT_466475 [Hypholoma sublateritium FD-334 SS-4]